MDGRLIESQRSKAPKEIRGNTKVNARCWGLAPLGAPEQAPAAFQGRPMRVSVLRESSERPEEALEAENGTTGAVKPPRHQKCSCKPPLAMGRIFCHPPPPPPPTFRESRNDPHSAKRPAERRRWASTAPPSSFAQIGFLFVRLLSSCLRCHTARQDKARQDKPCDKSKKRHTRKQAIA